MNDYNTCIIKFNRALEENEYYYYPSCVFLTRNVVHPQTKQIGNYMLADIMSVFFQQAQAYNLGTKKVYIVIEIGDDPALSNEEQIFIQIQARIIFYLLHFCFAQTKRIELTMEQIIFINDDPVTYSNEFLRSSMACIKPFLTAKYPIFENN